MECAMAIVADPGTVLICGDHFDGRSDTLSGPVEILVRDGLIRELAATVSRPPGARIVDLAGHTTTPGFIDCHAHLTMNAAILYTGGYFSPGDDPARLTWFDDEMQTLCDTVAQLGMPVAVHTGAAEGCKQAIRCGARSLEHAYLIDAEAIAMAEQAGVFLVPTMQMTREDLHELADGTLAPYTAAKFRRDADQIQQSQRTRPSRRHHRHARRPHHRHQPHHGGRLRHANRTPAPAVQATRRWSWLKVYAKD
jgi:imidazolonepropionase-like amidohydrolase